MTHSVAAPSARPILDGDDRVVPTLNAKRYWTYALFVRAMAQHTKFQRPALTPAERAEQERIAAEIIASIVAKDGAS